MPKKTREEKIRAAQRRFKIIYKEVPYKSAGEKKVSEQVFSTPAPVSKQEDTRLIYFRQDLTKSLTIIGGIIALEILLYFASINHYLWLK